jgi:hypothetical protein
MLKMDLGSSSQKNESMEFVQREGRGQTPNPNVLVFILVVLTFKSGDGLRRLIPIFGSTKKFWKNPYFHFFWFWMSSLIQFFGCPVTEWQYLRNLNDIWMESEQNLIRIRTESEYNGNRILKESQRDLKGIRILLAEGNVFLPEDLLISRKFNLK